MRIVKSDHLLIFIYDIGGNLLLGYFAKNAIIHIFSFAIPAPVFTRINSNGDPWIA
jgi:hypothetical protein